jgi:hypothetical protein
MKCPHDPCACQDGGMQDRYETCDFVHVDPKTNSCDHDFKGWREFDDGNGGEQVCTKCGMGAMAYTLRTGF